MKDWEWKDEYRLEIPAIDIQHKRIFASIARIAQGASDDDRLRAEAEIIKPLGLLQEHFSLAEGMMREFRYPDIEQHIEEHRQFHSDVHHLAQTSLMKKGGVPREALTLAHKWLTEHIMVSDRHYCEFFSNPAQKSRRKKVAGKSISRTTN